ncbi:MAG: hypothetical protein ACRC0F_01860, partial [Cetobacterium sp.]
MMNRAVTAALNFSEGRPVKINYEDLKRYMNYEDIFMDDYLLPVLENSRLDYEFKGEFIVLKRREKKGE